MAELTYKEKRIQEELDSYLPKPEWMTTERYEDIKRWRAIDCYGYNSYEYEDYMDSMGVSRKELRAIVLNHI